MNNGAEFYLNYLKANYDVSYSTISTGSSSDPDRLTVVIKWAYNDPRDSENAHIVFLKKVLANDVEVSVIVATKSAYGYKSVPVESNDLGKQQAVIPLDVLMRLFDSIAIDKANAINYLAKSPELLTSKLQQVLEVQQKIIKAQKDTINKSDRWLSIMYSNVYKKVKSKFSRVFTDLPEEEFSYLHEEKPVDNGSDSDKLNTVDKE